MYNGGGSIAPRILTPVLAGGEWLALRYGHFTSGIKVLGTHWIRDWGGPRTVLDSLAKRENPWHSWESKPIRLARSIVTILSEIIVTCVMEEWEICCRPISTFRSCTVCEEVETPVADLWKLLLMNTEQNVNSGCMALYSQWIAEYKRMSHLWCYGHETQGCSPTHCLPVP
jgi:hypothetical protein